MRIVVHGPERRVGALQGDNVVDLSGGYAKLGEAVPYAAAAANAPPSLEQFILLGDRALEAAQRAQDHVASGDGPGQRGERVLIPVGETLLHAPLAHRGVKICMAPRIGSGFENDTLFLRVGDIVEVPSPQIGLLRNRIVAKS